jgi:hypothetical protein
MKSEKSIRGVRAGVTQTGIAGGDLARAIREYGRAQNCMAKVETLALTFDDIGLLPLEGDYDILVARKLRAMAERFRAPVLAPEILDSMAELLAEIHEAGV